MARGLAALAVTAFHSNAAAVWFHGPRFAWMSSLEHGVDFFFVLSGFIILMAHSNDIGRSQAIVDYVKKRAIRLLPVLWLVVLGYAALRLLGGQMTDGTTLLGSLFPHPSLDRASPAVVWTLRHEVVFYISFVVLIWARRWGIVLFGLWLVAALAQLALSLTGRPVTGIASFYLSTYAVDFIIGMVLAAIHQRRNFAPRIWPLALGLGLLVGFLALAKQAGLDRTALTDYISPGATGGVLILGLIFCLIIHGLLRLEARIIVPKALVLLGGASYALYLVHTPINSIAQRIAIFLPQALLNLGAGHFMLIVLGIVGALALHWGFELPVSRWLRQRLVKKRGRETESLPHPAT